MNKEKSFEMIFRTHFEPLSLFAMRYLHDLDESKNIVHDVFAILWERFDTMDEDTNYKSYLFTGVRNRCLNAIRDKKNNVAASEVEDPKLQTAQTTLETQELRAEIDYAINTLPEKCRMVFLYSREEELSYAQIALKMSISVKTVENQMSKALKHLRQHLAEYLVSIILFYFSIGVTLDSCVI